MTYTRTQPWAKPPRGGYLDPLINLFTGHFAGTLSTSTGTGDFDVVLGINWRLVGVSMAIETTADQAIQATVYKQGVAVFESTAPPEIPAGSVVSGLVSTGFTSTSAGEYTSTEAFSMKLSQVGTSTAPGENLAVAVHWKVR